MGLDLKWILMFLVLRPIAMCLLMEGLRTTIVLQQVFILILQQILVFEQILILQQHWFYSKIAVKSVSKITAKSVSKIYCKISISFRKITVNLELNNVYNNMNYNIAFGKNFFCCKISMRFDTEITAIFFAVKSVLL